jgi:uncharacterized phage protein (TIGR01671 family)
MREIKFRGFSVEEKKMYNPAFPTWNGGVEVWRNNKPQTTTECYYSQNGPADQMILMEYINKKDMNNKKVYVGDCMLVEEYVIGFVFFDIEKSCYSFRLHDGISPHDYNHESFDVEEISNYNIDKMEVIGNI